MTASVRPLNKPQRFNLRRFNSIGLTATRQYLIPGFIPRSGVTIAWGPPKEGKTSVILDVALHAACRIEYRDAHIEHGPVAYLCCEGAAGIGKRIEAFKQEIIGPDSNRPEAEFYLLTDSIKLTADVDDIIAAVRAQVGRDPVAIVIDTLNRSLGGDENSWKQVTEYIDAADKLVKAFGCAVIIIQHCGSDDGRLRGFSGLAGNPDCQISIRKTPDGLILATVVAMKDGPEGKTIASRLREVIVGTEKSGEPITACVVDPVDLSPRNAEPDNLPKGVRATPPNAELGNLPKGVRALMRALANVSKAKETMVEVDGHPTAAELLDDVRVEFNRQYKHNGNGDEKDALRKAWKRAHSNALDLSLMGQREVHGSKYLYLSKA